MNDNIQIAQGALQAEEAEILARIEREQRNLEEIRSALSLLNGNGTAKSEAALPAKSNDDHLWKRNHSGEPAKLAPRLLAALPKSGKATSLQNILTKLYGLEYMDVSDPRYKTTQASLNTLVKKDKVLHLRRGTYALKVSDPTEEASVSNEVKISKGDPTKTRSQIILDMVSSFGDKPVSSGMVYDKYKEYFDKLFPTLKKRYHKTTRINAVLSGLCSQRKLIRESVGRYTWNPSQPQ